MSEKKISIDLVEPNKSEDELRACKEIRRIVFTEGQGIPAEADNDGRDGEALHILAKIGDEPAGTARMREVDHCLRLERIAVLEDMRGRGIGIEIVKFMTDLGVLAGMKEVNMHAQAYLKDFYGQLGYKVRGDEYDEVGIPHVEMYFTPPDTTS